MEKFKFYSVKLCGLIILIFILQFFIRDFTEAFLLNENSWIEIWRFLTAIFLHGGTMHLLYNLFALILFGSILESLVGGKRFLYVFFTTGILANLAAVNFNPASLGASGAIFGIIGALIMIRPTLVVWAFGLPMPIFIAGILWAVGDAVGLFIPSNVGNAAHLSGMLFGLLLGIFFKKEFGKRRKIKREKNVVRDEEIRSWEERYMR